MADVQFLMREEVDWSDSMVLVAFPTAGSAANIAAHYLRRRLDLPLLGSIHMDEQSPVVAVTGGIATSPLRIHGGKVECRLGAETCPEVFLITSDLPLEWPGMRDVSQAILQMTRGARMVLCLDAVIRDPGDDTPDVYCASPDGALRDLLVQKNVKPMREAIVVGMTGQILLAAEAASLDAAALFVEAAEDVPDGRAAAALIHALDVIIPSIDLDPEPLLEEAMELEKQLAEASRKAARSQEPKASPTFI